jgi:alkanesulfonate monooxygenase SsuD/methylene tetrahydromethanopterin reductase-like flavin-dependent oxidoreductase (luciferase family)
MVFSAAQVVCCGLDDAELKDRADAIGGTPESLRERGLAGSPDELVDQIGRFAEAGAARIYLRLLDLTDLDHLELLAARVLPQV